MRIGGFYGAAGIVQQIPAVEYPVDHFRKLMDIIFTGESRQYESSSG